MATYPLRAVQSLVGLDYRMTDADEFTLGIMLGNAWSSYATHGFSSYISAAGTASGASRPYVTDVAPFDITVYPAGTLFVVMGAGPGTPTVIRQAGITTNPLTVLAASIPFSNSTTGATGRRYGYLYRAIGVPAGATGTITFKKTSAGTVLATLSITEDGTYEVPEITGFNTDTLTIVSSWAGGVGTARFESFALHPFYTGNYVAVPPTLPAGFTLRTSSDTFRGGHFGDRTHADQTQLLPGPYITFENLGVLTTSAGSQDDALAGMPVFSATNCNIWVDGALWHYPVIPVCLNGAFRGSSGASLGTYHDPGIPFGFPGYIPPYAGGTITSTRTVRGSTTNWSATITVTDPLSTGVAFTAEVWAGPSGSETLQSTGSYTAGTTVVPITPVLPVSAGDAVSILVKIYPPGSYWDGTGSITLTTDSIPDLPLPFTAVGHTDAGASLVAPGGYVPSYLATPTSSRTNYWLAQGVTSRSTVGKEMVAFVPAADGWYRVTYGGTPQTAIGESAFDHDSKSTKSIDRGHAGRVFHSKIDGSAAPTTTALVAYTPTPAVTAAGGTTHTLNDGSWWKWASIAAPSAGTWRVTVTLMNFAALQRGLRIGWSLTDTTVLDPTTEIEFQPYDMLMLISETLRGTGNTPPGSPAADDAWIIDTAPTGAWAGLKAGTVVVWDKIGNTWRPYVPKRGSYIDDFLAGSWRWYDGTAWKLATDPIFTFDVTTTGAQTISLVLGAISSEKTGTAGQVKLAWAASP